MIVISNAEFAANTQKYVELADNDQVVVQDEGVKSFEVRPTQRVKKPDADFFNAVSIEQMKKWAHEDIHEMYKLPR